MRSTILSIVLCLFTGAAGFAQDNLDSLRQIIGEEAPSDRVELLLELSEMLRDVDYEEAAAEALKAAALANERDDLQLYAKALYAAGKAYYAGREYLPAKHYYILALNLFRAGDDLSATGDCATDLGNCYERFEMRDSALVYHKLSLDYREQTGEQLKISECLTNIGLIYWWFGDSDEALMWHSRALEIREQFDVPHLTGATLNNIGIIYWKWGRYEQALEYYTRSLKLREELGNMNGVTRMLNNIGMVYLAMDRYADAEEYFLRALEIAESVDDHINTAYSLYNLGEVQQRMGYYTSSLDYLNRSLSLYQETKMMDGVCLVQKKLGDTHTQLGNYTLAIEKYNSAYELAIELQTTYRQAEALLGMGMLYIKMGEYDRSLEYLSRSLEMSDQESFREFEKESYLAFANAFEKLGDYQSALANYKNYTSLHDSLFSAENQNKLAEVRAVYETRKKEQEIENLKAIAQRDELMQDMLIAGLALILLVAALLLFLNRRKNREIKIRQQTEAAFQRNEELLRQLTDSIQDVFFLTDTAWQQVYYASPAYERLWGRTRESLYSAPLSWLESIVDEDREQVRLQLLKAFDSNEDTRETMEYRITMPGGKVRWMKSRLFAIRDKEQNTIRIAGITEDISERKAAESKIREAHQALAMSEERFRILFQNSNDIIMTLKKEGVQTYISQSVERIAGIAAEDIIGTNGEQFVHPDDLTRVKEVMKSCIDEPGKTVRFEFRLNKETEPAVYIEAVAINLLNDPAVKSVVVNARDVSERKKVETELREERETLIQLLEDLRITQKKLVETEKMAALGSLVAGVAHEINTPIGVGVTAASHLRDKANEFLELINNAALKKSDLTKLVTHIKESTSLIMTNLERAAELVVSFKQVSVDQSSHERRVFKVKSYLEGIVTSLRHELKKTRHEVVIDCDEQLQIDSYPGALSQVVTNLIMNSLHHAFDEVGEGTMFFKVTTDDGHLNILYSDNGKGIEPDVLEKVFDPFFTTRRDKGGSGLGMHIVYNIITQQMGGKINVKSELGKGAQFSIALPLVRKDTAGLVAQTNGKSYD